MSTLSPAKSGVRLRFRWVGIKFSVWRNLVINNYRITDRLRLQIHVESCFSLFDVHYLATGRGLRDYTSKSINSLNGVSSAIASLTTVFRFTNTSPFSMILIWRLSSKPSLKAKSSWVRFLVCRISRTRLPNCIFIISTLSNLKSKMNKYFVLD